MSCPSSIGHSTSCCITLKRRSTVKEEEVGEKRKKKRPSSLLLLIIIIVSYIWSYGCQDLNQEKNSRFLLWLFYLKERGSLLVTEGFFLSSSCSPCVIHTGYLWEWIRSLSFFRSDEGKRVEKVRPFFSTALPLLSVIFILYPSLHLLNQASLSFYFPSSSFSPNVFLKCIHPSTPSAPSSLVLSHQGTKFYPLFTHSLTKRREKGKEDTESDFEVQWNIFDRKSEIRTPEEQFLWYFLHTVKSEGKANNWISKVQVLFMSRFNSHDCPWESSMVLLFSDLE